MTELDIKTSVDRIFDQLRAEIAKYAQEAGRFEALADSYWNQLCALRNERERLKSRLDDLLGESRGCGPECQICHPEG